MSDPSLFGDLPLVAAPLRRSRRKRVFRGAKHVDTPLDLAQQPRVRNGRHVVATPENEGVYEAIMVLRRAGISVYRAGALHKVDGRLLTTNEMINVADIKQNASKPPDVHAKDGGRGRPRSEMER